MDRDEIHHKMSKKVVNFRDLRPAILRFLRLPSSRR